MIFELFFLDKKAKQTQSKYVINMTRTINFRKKTIDSNAKKNSWVGVPKTSIFNLGLRQALCMFSNYNMYVCACF